MAKSEYVKVDMKHTLGLKGYGLYGPGEGIVVPRGFAEGIGLEILGDAKAPDTARAEAVKAQRRAAAKGGASKGTFDVKTAKREDLEAEYNRRLEAGEVEEIKKGSGKDGAILVEDLRTALAPDEDEDEDEDEETDADEEDEE